MASLSMSYGLHEPRLLGIDDMDEEDEGDTALEDAGFFGVPSSTLASYSAQDALNELGLQPSPPKPSRYAMVDEDEDGNDFDLDRILDMEEEQEVEQHQPEDDDLDEPFESNGLLDGDLSERSSSPKTSPCEDDDTLAATDTNNRQEGKTYSAPAQPPKASTSRTILPHPSRASAVDDSIGLNGLPKYIAAGTASATLLDGSIVKFERKRRLKGWKPQTANYGTGSTGLLSQPVHRIIERIDSLQALQVVEHAEKGKTRNHRAPRCTEEMWQERYRPQRFTDLVGEERTHRDVLRWLKEWDACVFGRKFHTRKRWRKEGAEDDAYAYHDKYNRPKERILLLGGPAGMGKTTLAHVIANKCGYLVHELNASDDRSARTVEDRVRDALESKSLKQQSDLPTCLVLDEVDGATGGRGEEGGGFIRALIQLIEKGSGGGNRKKGSKKQRPLLRPIICICNDPYSPNLRALRPYSKLIRVARPSTPLLIRRLRYICDLESIPTDTKALAVLVDSCQGDVRSCLNVLQMISAEGRGVTIDSIKQGHASESSNHSASSGVKDSNTSIHQIWATLFQSLTTKEKAQARGRTQLDGTNLGEGNKMVTDILGCGEMDKILAGCFEHYPNLRLVDDGWWRFSQMHDWIHWYEHMTKRSWEVGAQTEMWQYLPWSFVGWKQLFANTSNELPSYPRADYENHLKRTAFDEITADLATSLPAMTRSHFSSLSIVTELGPTLVTLLSPDLKLINSQLVRPEERSTLTSLISIMRHCNLDFVLDKNEQGQTYYRMEPPLEAFVSFEGKKSQLVGPAKFQLRQMVVGELHAARTRAKQIEAGEGASNETVERAGQMFKDVYSKKNSGTAVAALAAKERVAVDFFGRPIVAKISKGAPLVPASLPDSILGRRKDKENDAADLVKAAKRTKLKVFYNYNEGYSNAVRKPIKMASLLM